MRYRRVFFYLVAFTALTGLVYGDVFVPEPGDWWDHDTCFYAGGAPPSVEIDGMSLPNTTTTDSRVGYVVPAGAGSRTFYFEGNMCYPYVTMVLSATDGVGGSMVDIYGYNLLTNVKTWSESFVNDVSQSGPQFVADGSFAEPTTPEPTATPEPSPPIVDLTPVIDIGRQISQFILLLVGVIFVGILTRGVIP